ALKMVVALHQGPIVFGGWQKLSDKPQALSNLVETLLATDRFYDYMGGLAGYHLKTLELIHAQLTNTQEPDPASIFLPPTVDIRAESNDLKKMVSTGLMALESCAEIYAVGGAGDRLKLVDDKTLTPMPVARLEFGGHTLLEWLVRDLEARE